MKIPTILKTSVLTLAASMLCATTAPAQQTKLLTADKHNEYGLVYSLPNTAIDIDVTATRTVRKAGPYYKYARKYLGTDKVVKEDSESWTINSVTLRTRGVADTEETYLMQLKNGSLTYIKQEFGIDAIREIDETVNRLKGTEKTSIFHGRDLFAY